MSHRESEPLCRPDDHFPFRPLVAAPISLSRLVIPRRPLINREDRERYQDTAHLRLIGTADFNLDSFHFLPLCVAPVGPSQKNSRRTDWCRKFLRHRPEFARFDQIQATRNGAVHLHTPAIGDGLRRAKVCVSFTREILPRDRCAL